MLRNLNQPESEPAPVALVTGGAVRVGRAIGLALGCNGFRLAVHHNRSKQAAADLVTELSRIGTEARILASDLTRPTAPAKLINDVTTAFGRLDLLVNSAALFYADDASVTELARMKVLNYDAAEALLRAAEPHLIQTGGSVINIADIAGYWEIRKHRAYSRTKAALLELTHRKALELAPHGIRVNAVSPGAVMFPVTYTEAQRRRIIEQIPLGRAGSAEDVAQAVVYLARAGFVTGQVIAVDGGRMLRLIEEKPHSPRNPGLN